MDCWYDFFQLIFDYTGRELDPHTGLYFNRARWYDPSAKRFLSEDPIGYAAGDANLYRYVGNNPTNATDPSGHFALGGLGIVAGIAIVGLATANVSYRVETAQYENAFDAAAQADWAAYEASVTNARYAHAVGNIGVTAAMAAPIAFVAGAGIGIAGAVAAHAGCETAFTVGSVDIGVGMLGYSTVQLARATPYMDGPQRLDAWGRFGASLAAGIPPERQATQQAPAWRWALWIPRSAAWPYVH